MMVVHNLQVDCAAALPGFLQHDTEGGFHIKLVTCSHSDNPGLRFDRGAGLNLSPGLGARVEKSR